MNDLKALLKSKTGKIVAAVVGLILVLLAGFIIAFIIKGRNYSVVPYTNNSMVKNNNGGLKYDDGDLKLDIYLIDETGKNAFLNAESNGEYYQGVTKDGVKFEGRGSSIIYEVNDKIVCADVKKNKSDIDAGKVAGVATAVTKTSGYLENCKDWNTDSKALIFDNANCIVYYPAQLVISSKSATKCVLKDTRSKATLTITLDKNRWNSMDEVENFLYSDKNGDVLASGTDWYATLFLDTKTNMQHFSHTGLGNEYQVSCDLVYEDKYSFVFNDLRKLIKCRFIDDGKWVSNARVNTVGKKVNAVAKEPSVYDPHMTQTSYYFENFKCVAYYPDVFTKAYQGDDGIEYFTDPVTGAYIAVGKAASDVTTQADLQASMDLFETELVGDRACKGKLVSGGLGMISYAAIQDGYMYILNMIYPEEYDYVYKESYGFVGLAVEGEAISTTEMQDIFFPNYNCNVTIPLQWEEVYTNGNQHIYRDVFAGFDITLDFIDISSDGPYANIYDEFEVTGKDKDIIYGEYWVKWHDECRAAIGAVSKNTSVLIDIPYPNGYSVYENCWDRFAISFTDEEEMETPSDKVREEVNTNLEEMQGYGTEYDPEEEITEPVKKDEAKEQSKEEPKDEIKEETTEKTKREVADVDPDRSFDSSYDILMNDPENLYKYFPFKDIEEAEVRSVTAGDLSVVTYDLNCENWDEIIMKAYETLLKDYDVVSMSYDEVYGVSDCIQVLMSGKPDGDFAEVEVYFYADTDTLKVMFYEKGAGTTPYKGKVNCTWADVEDYLTSDDLTDYFNFLEKVDATHTAMEYLLDPMDMYLRMDMKYADLSSSGLYDFEDESWSMIPIIDAGRYEDHTYYVDRRYYGLATGDLFVVWDDGSFGDYFE